ncbi:hypothetical protein [Paenibacillus larvae]|uniref:hypothetical protein n=1 Tax=Paenibacillus larvae TaxID=1464 RepID=UPI0006275A4A|nr:hypothetical protein [Paenibacillus larvae]
MKKGTEFRLEDGTVYTFRIPYSSIIKLRDEGIDLLSKKGMEDIDKDPGKLIQIFWVGLHAAGQDFTLEQATDIMDDILSEMYVEDFAEILRESIQIKTKQSHDPDPKKKQKKSR